MEKKVTFKNYKLTLAGLLYLPEGFGEENMYAAIFCVHSGGVKKQTSVPMISVRQSII